MKKTMKWALVIVVLLAVMGCMGLMGVLAGAVLTPVVGAGVASLMLWIFTLGASALYWYGVIVGMIWLAEYGYFG